MLILVGLGVAWGITARPDLNVDQYMKWRTQRVLAVVLILLLALQIGPRTELSIHPALALGFLAAYALYRHWRGANVGSTPAAEARFYQRLLTELQSGIGIRSALSNAIDGFDDLDLSAADRRLQTGSAMTSVMDALSPSLRHTGDLARAALELGAETGGDLRPVVGDLIAAATELEAVEREVEVQTAQARFSAALVGLLPVAVAVILMVARGGLPTEAVGRALVLAGLAFQLTGLSIVAWMLRR